MASSDFTGIGVRIALTDENLISLIFGLVSWIKCSLSVFGRFLYARLKWGSSEKELEWKYLLNESDNSNSSFDPLIERYSVFVNILSVSTASVSRLSCLKCFAALSIDCFAEMRLVLPENSVKCGSNIGEFSFLESSTICFDSSDLCLSHGISQMDTCSNVALLVKFVQHLVI